MLWKFQKVALGREEVLEQCFSIPTSCDFKKLKWIWVSPPFNVQSQNDQAPFVGLHHFP